MEIPQAIASVPAIIGSAVEAAPEFSGFTTAADILRITRSITTIREAGTTMGVDTMAAEGETAEVGAMVAEEAEIKERLLGKLRQQGGSGTPAVREPRHFQVAVGRGGFARVGE